MSNRSGTLGLILMVLIAPAVPRASADDDHGDAAPLLARYCNACHAGEKPKAGLDLKVKKGDIAQTGGALIVKKRDIAQPGGALIRMGKCTLDSLLCRLTEAAVVHVAIWHAPSRSRNL